jgi:hypothetical protein
MTNIYNSVSQSTNQEFQKYSTTKYDEKKQNKNNIKGVLPKARNHHNHPERPHKKRERENRL